MYIQPHFTLCLTLLQFRYFFFFLTNWKSVATLCWASFSGNFPTAFIHFVFSVSHFGNSCNISNFLIITVLLLCWQRLKAGGEVDDRGWDGWMASPTQWTWVWVSSGRWWWTGKPGVLQSMESQRVGHDWLTELNWLLYLLWWLVISSLWCYYWDLLKAQLMVSMF